MFLADLNKLPDDDAVREFLRCCGSTRWARAMTAARPFVDPSAVDATADAIFDILGPGDWLESFAAHPRIGTGRAGEVDGAGRAGPASESTEWSANEQAGALAAGATVRERLAALQRDYEARFGYIFIICATGRSAEEMLASLEQRLSHAPASELRAAAEEQRKITHLRIAKLFAGSWDS